MERDSVSEMRADERERKTRTLLRVATEGDLGGSLIRTLRMRKDDRDGNAELGLAALTRLRTKGEKHQLDSETHTVRAEVHSLTSSMMR